MREQKEEELSGMHPVLEHRRHSVLSAIHAGKEEERLLVGLAFFP